MFQFLKIMVRTITDLPYIRSYIHERARLGWVKKKYKKNVKKMKTSVMVLIYFDNYSFKISQFSFLSVMFVKRIFTILNVSGFSLTHKFLRFAAFSTQMSRIFQSSAPRRAQFRLVSADSVNSPISVNRRLHWPIKPLSSILLCDLDCRSGSRCQCRYIAFSDRRIEPVTIYETWPQRNS